MTRVCAVASARAPALGVYPSLRAAACTRRRTSSETARLPERAHEGVLRETFAVDATSPMVTTTPPHIDRLANRSDGISPIAPYARAIFTCLSARSGFHTRTGSLHCRSGPADLRRKTAHRLLPRA